jgi:DNA-3-methyladenine glycosylase II
MTTSRSANLTSADLAGELTRADKHIKKFAPAFAEVIDSTGPCDIGKNTRSDSSHFSSLVTSIVGQQLSTTAAATINNRLLTAAGGSLTPDALTRLDEATLRSVGLSGAKTKTIQGLVNEVTSGALDLDLLARNATDDEISHRLTQLWGIGEWTAHMFLIFSLHRLDVWPVGDLGVRKGWALVHGVAGDPGASALATVAEQLRPYRSVVAWYCWRSLEQ